MGKFLLKYRDFFSFRNHVLFYIKHQYREITRSFAKCETVFPIFAALLQIALINFVFYRAGKPVKIALTPEGSRGYANIQSFFTPDAIADICRKLVGHYFVLTQDELDAWDADPEAFSNDECGDSWKYSLRVSQQIENVSERK